MKENIFFTLRKEVRKYQKNNKNFNLLINFDIKKQKCDLEKFLEGQNLLGQSGKLNKDKKSQELKKCIQKSWKWKIKIKINSIFKHHKKCQFHVKIDHHVKFKFNARECKFDMKFCFNLNRISAQQNCIII